MPTYTWRCPECGESITLQLTLGEYESQVCTLCDNHDSYVPMKRVYNDVSIILPEGFHE